MGRVCPTLFPQLNQVFEEARTNSQLRERLTEASRGGNASELVNTALAEVKAYDVLESSMAASTAWPSVQSLVITVVANISLVSAFPIEFVPGSVDGPAETTIFIGEKGMTVTCSGSP